MSSELVFENYEKVIDPNNIEIDIVKNSSTEYTYIKGTKTLHSILDLPAYIYRNYNNIITKQSWYCEGVLHRNDGYADIMTNNEGNIIYVKWYKNGKLHNDNGPAYIQHYNNGNIKSKTWYQNDIIHNSNGPAIINYEEDGITIISESYYHNGTMFRNEGHTNIIYKHGIKICETFSTYTKFGLTYRTLYYYNNGNVKKEDLIINNIIQKSRSYPPSR